MVHYMASRSGSLVRESVIGDIPVTVYGIPLENGDIVLKIFSEEHTPAEVINAILNTGIDLGVLIPTETSSTPVYVPKNEVSSSLKIKDLLKSLGVISEDPTFQKMLPAEADSSTRLDEINIASILTSNETGLKIEAVAAAIIRGRGSLSECLFFDRPYLSVHLSKDGKVVATWIAQGADGLKRGPKNTFEKYLNMPPKEASEEVRKFVNEAVPNVPKDVLDLVALLSFLNKPFRESYRKVGSNFHFFNVQPLSYKVKEER